MTAIVCDEIKSLLPQTTHAKSSSAFSRLPMSISAWVLSYCTTTEWASVSILSREMHIIALSFGSCETIDGCMDVRLGAQSSFWKLKLHSLSMDTSNPSTTDGLAAMTSLKTLHLRWCHDGDAASLSTLTKLSSLKFDSHTPRYTENILLAAASNLRSVRINDVSSQLLSLTALTSLELTTSFGKTHWNRLLMMSSLVTLKCPHMFLSGRSLAKVSTRLGSSLKTLHVAGINSRPLPDMMPLIVLHDLGLKYLPRRVEWLKPLMPLTLRRFGVTYIGDNIGDNDRTFEAINCICHLPLERLGFGFGKRVTWEAFSCGSYGLSLKHLTIQFNSECCRFLPIDVLKQFPALESLELFGGFFQPCGGLILSHVTSLVIQNQGFTDKDRGIHSLVETFPSLSSLTIYDPPSHNIVDICHFTGLRTLRLEKPPGLKWLCADVDNDKRAEELLEMRNFMKNHMRSSKCTVLTYTPVTDDNDNPLSSICAHHSYIF